MDHVLLNSEQHNKPLRLDEQKVNPIEIFVRFFEDFNLIELRLILWRLVETAITTDNEFYADPEERSNLLYHYARIEELIEAVFIIDRASKEPAE